MASPIEILYLEDNPMDVELAMNILESEDIAYSMKVVDDKTGFHEAITKEKFDLILADYKLPSFDGMTALKMSNDICPSTPFIFLSGTMGEEYAIEAMKTGATDYVLKSLLLKLPAAVRRAMQEAGIRKEKQIAENKRLESELKYRNLVDNALIGVYRSTLDGDILFANDSLAKMLGFESHYKLIGKNASSFYVQSADRQAMLNIMGDSGEISNYELDLKRVDGKIITCILNSSLTGNTISGTLMDITNRKVVEIELQNSQKQIRAITDSAHDAIIMMNSHGKVIFWNPAAEKLFGTTEQEMIGSDLHSKMAPDSLLKAYSGAMRKWASSGKGNAVGKTMELPAIRKDGSQFQIELSLSTVVLQGKYVAVGVVRDITERKRNEEIIQRNNEFLKNIIESLTHPFYVVNTVDYSIAMANSAAYRFSKNSAETKCYAMIHGKDKPCSHSNTFCPLQRVVDTKQSVIVFYSDSENDQETFYELYSYPIFDDYNNVVQIIEYLMDVTDRKEAEKEIYDQKQFIETVLDNLPIGVALNFIDSRKTFYVNRKFEEIYGWTGNQMSDINEFFSKVFPDPDYRKKMKKQILSDIESNDPDRLSWKKILATGSDGSHKTVDAQNIALPQQNTMVSTVIDVTKERIAEENLIAALEQTKQREYELSLMLKASEAVLHNLSFHKAARLIFDIAKDATGATAGYIALLNESGEENEVLFLDDGGMKCTVNPELPMPIRGLRGEAYKSGEVACDNNFSKSEWMKFMPKGHVGLRNVLFAPLTDNGRVLGLMGLANKAEDFTENDRALAKAFGDITAVALKISRYFDIIRENENRLKQIIDSTKLGTWDWDPVSNKMILGHHWFTMLGYAPNQFPGESATFYKLLHPDDLERFTNTLNKHIEGDTDSFSEAVRMKTNDGNWKWVKNYGKCIQRDEEGLPIRVVGIHEDINEKKLAEDELQKYREHLEVLVRDRTKELEDSNAEILKLFQAVEQSPASVVITDCNAKISYVNQAFVNVTGYTLEETLGKNPKILNSGTHSNKFYRDMWDTILSGNVWKGDLHNKKKNGELYWERSHIAPISDSEGNIQSYVAIKEDITREKQQEEELLKAFSEIKTAHDKLDSAHKELQQTQSQLIQSEKMVALGQLIAGVAHEINSPLGAIKSQNDSFLRDIDPILNEILEIIQSLPEGIISKIMDLIRRASEMKEFVSSREERNRKRNYIRVFEEAGYDKPMKLASLCVNIGDIDFEEYYAEILNHEEREKILELINKMVNLKKGSNIVKGAIDNIMKIVFALKNFSRFDSSEEKALTNIKDSIETVLTLYHNKMKHGVDIVKNYKYDKPIPCYQDELNQVWTNLLHNALHAMEYSGTITISVEQQNDYLCVELGDSGKGIPEDIRDKIFEPFFTNKPLGEGTGLGLDIVSRIVKKHNGKIDFESQLGKGTTFRILLPIS